MLQEFQNHIKNNFSFLKEKKMLLTVSGGVDSVVLVHLMKELKFDFGIAHCNFQLRGVESDGDYQFVIQLAQQVGVPFYDIHFETKKIAVQEKLSIQMAARKLRYDWFRQLVNEHGYDYIVTGHHADDNLETFLINIIRGTGLEGMQGIPEITNDLIRPLLPFSREQIELFAIANKIKWREDSSNVSTKYLRNKLRHDVIPILKELNLTLLPSFQETIKHLKESQDIVTDALANVIDQVVEIQSDCIKIDLKKLQKYSNPTAYLYPLLKPYGFTSWKDIHDLMHSQSGKQIYSDQYHIVKDRNTFLIRLRRDTISYQTYDITLESQEINDPIIVRWEQEESIKRTSQKSIYVDADKLKKLTLRKWEEGDVFQPYGMKGKKKKLSKFFKDEKLSLFEKEAIWLLCSGNEIVWIIGQRADHRFSVDKNTNRILKFTVYEK